MSGDRHGHLTRLIAACVVERPERAGEVDLDDLARGPAREIITVNRHAADEIEGRS